MSDFLDRTEITAENIDLAKEKLPLDQRGEMKIGCFTWAFVSDDGQSGRITVWPESGRAALCTNGDSFWGDWYEDEGLLWTDDGCHYSSDGNLLHQPITDPDDATDEGWC